MTQRMGYTFREEFDIWLYNRDDIRKREQRRGGELIMMYDYIKRYGGDDREIKIEMIDYIEEMMRKATNRFKREYNRYMMELMIEEGERGIKEYMKGDNKEEEKGRENAEVQVCGYVRDSEMWEDT